MLAVTQREEYIKKVEVETRTTENGIETKTKWLFSTGRTFEETHMGLDHPSERNLFANGRVWATLQGNKVIAIRAY